VHDRPDGFAARAATDVLLNDPRGVSNLVLQLCWIADGHYLRVLLDREPAEHVAVDSLGVRDLQDCLQRANAGEQPAVLAARVRQFEQERKYALDSPDAVAKLLQEHLDGCPEPRLSTSGLELARRAAESTALGSPLAVSCLLQALRGRSAGEPATILSARAAAQMPLDDNNVTGIMDLLKAMRQAGQHEAAEVLLARLPAAGLFYIVRHQGDNAVRFRYGRDPDGSPAEPWGWDDLD
jgi:hypothetical protein